MKRQKRYHGVIIPMITPFTESGKLDEHAVIKILERIIKAAAYPFILGTTGESASIPHAIRIQLVKLVTGYVNQRTTVYAGISDNCLQNSLTLAQKYYDMGIEVFVAHLPSYYPLNPDMMRRYYEVLAERCPGEIMIYNIKSTTHMSLPVDVIETLSRHPKMVGLKDSEREFQRLQSLATRFSERADFSLFCGWTTQSAEALLMGFDGIVPSTGNLIPEKFQQLYDAVGRGELQKARQLQHEINLIADIHQADMLGSEAIVALKMMMAEVGLCGPTVLPPLMALPSQQKNRIIEAMKRYF